MKPRDIALLAILFGAGVFIVRRVKKSDGSPVSLDDLTVSETGSRLNIDNGIPTRLVPRARGLAVIVGVLRGAGFRVTSMYRSPLLQAAVVFENAHPDVSVDVSQLIPQGGEHTEMLACDVDEESGESAANLLETNQRLRGIPLIAHALRSTLVEVDHVHCAFTDAALVAIGRENKT